MTALTHPQAERGIRPRVGDGAFLVAMVIGATVLTLVMNAGMVAETLQGRFADPDDAMRLVEVRTWLAGQSWFDMTALRLDPPHGSFMHWSRLVDLPAAAMIRLFGLVTDPVRAERLAAVAVPTLWLAALYAGTARLATLLVGRSGRLPALVGMILSGATLVQFGPGRIGHHGPETVALVYAAGCAVAALDPRRGREAFVCGCLVALSLSMSLETLPFHVALAGTLVGLWVWRGVELNRTLAWFGAGLLVGLPLLYLLTVGPDHWFAPVCDAYGAAHLGAGLIGAGGVVGLARLRLRTIPARLAAAALVAIAVGAYMASAYPACLHSPFAGVDPLVRELWLSHVIESEPLTTFFHARPMIGLAIVCPVALGLAGSLMAAVSSRGTASFRFLLVAALSAAGLALAFWQVRVIGSVTPLALCGGVYLVGALADRLATRGHFRAAGFAPAAILAFSSTIWLLALPPDSRSEAEANAAEAKTACLSPSALAPLASLPAGSVVAPLDSGSHLLEATALSVLAAPYHRNDDGNRFAFDVFLAAPDAAAGLLKTRHVTYVMTCPGMAEMDRLAARAPTGLAARLAAGELPNFLRHVQVAGTPYKVYAVTP